MPQRLLPLLALLILLMGVHPVDAAELNLSHLSLEPCSVEDPGNQPGFARPMGAPCYVLSGDVDVVQNDGNFLRAGQVTYLLDEERVLALPTIGGQVFSQWSLGTESSRPSPKVP